MPRKASTTLKGKKKATTPKGKPATATKGRKQTEATTITANSKSATTKSATMPGGNGFRGLSAEILVGILMRLNIQDLCSMVKVNRAFRTLFESYHEAISAAALKNTKTTTDVAELFSRPSSNAPKSVTKLPKHVQSLRHLLKVEQLCKDTREFALKLDIIHFDILRDSELVDMGWVRDHLGLQFKESFMGFEEWCKELCQDFISNEIALAIISNGIKLPTDVHVSVGA